MNFSIQWITVCVIIVIGAAFRFQAIFSTDVVDPIRNDARDYVSYAFNLKTLGTYSRTTPANVRHELPVPPPDALRRPVYPLFLSLLLDPAESIESFITKTKVVQAVLSSLTLLICFVIARRLLDFRYAIGVLTLTALSPHIINMNVYLLSEVLFTFVQLLIFWCVTTWRENSAWRSFLAVGVLIAIAALTRAWVQYFVVVLAAWMLMSKDLRLSKMTTGVVFLSFLSVFLVWSVRNLIVLGVTSDSTLMINGLHHGMYPDFMYQGNPETRGFAYLFDPNSPAISDSVGSVLGEIVRRFQVDFWHHAYWYTVGKTLTLMSWGTIQGTHDIFIYPVTDSPFFHYAIWHWMHTVMRVIHAPVMLLALLGSLLLWLPSRILRLGGSKLFALRTISLFCGYFLAVHLVTAPFPRYAIPLKPLFFVMAMVPLKLILDRVISTNGRSS
ncbi:MAG: glycosyltransferase family 39 protein [Gammaproteobacteria bacterium]